MGHRSSDPCGRSGGAGRYEDPLRAREAIPKEPLDDLDPAEVGAEVAGPSTSAHREATRSGSRQPGPNDRQWQSVEVREVDDARTLDLRVELRSFLGDSSRQRHGDVEA